MREYKANEIRNIAMLGHGGKGKTSLTEAMIFNAGATDRMGRTTDGTCVTDYDPEEIKRGISISLALASIEWRDVKINILDVPGYFDMVGEMSSALRVVEGAVIVLNASSGWTVGADKAWDACEANGVAKLIYISQLDREHANFIKTLEQIKAKHDTKVAPIQLPIMDGGFKGYVDVLKNVAYLFEGKGLKECPVPGDLTDQLEEIRAGLMESAASASDELMEKYFDAGELTHEEIIEGLRIGIRSGEIAPILCGSAVENKNIVPLLDTIVENMPTAAQAKPVEAQDLKTGERVSLAVSEEGHLAAFVFKTISDNFVGKISMVKVVSGILTADKASTVNATTGKPEKPNNISTMLGKKQIPLPVLHAGDIGTMTKLVGTNTSDTLTSSNHGYRFDPIVFPEPCISFAVAAEKQGEEDKVFSGLARLQEEDPSFHVGKSPMTGETLISGQGELQLDVIINKLQSKFNAKAVLSDPKIPYRETIRKAVKVQGRHKKQSGGHGQFGDIWVEFEPIIGSDTTFEFVDKVVGGSVPRQYIPAVEKGLRDCIQKGVLAGYPVVNLRASLVDGSYHPVDSSEMAFKTAASLAFKKGCAEASPVLLEPICTVQVLVPEENKGDIIGDLNRRRGRIQGMNPMGDGMQEVVAEAPMGEMFKYATDLRSMTQARGSFTMKFERYEEMPANMAQKVIEQAKKDMVDDE